MPAKILVVDDEPDLELLIRQKFRKEIRRQQLHFIFAHNGLEALEKLQAQPDTDIVLTDISMPEMDGLTLLTKINELYPTLKAVIISAYSDLENIRTAMNGGAFDFLTKPINFQDLEITTNKNSATRAADESGFGTGTLSTASSSNIIDQSAARSQRAPAGGRGVARK